MASRTIPVPATEVNGNTIPSALWNAGPVAVNTFLTNRPMGVAMLNNTRQSIPNNTVTVMTDDTINVDSDSGFPTVPTMRYTCKVPGWYLAVANGVFSATTTGSIQVFIRKNGVDIFGAVGSIKPVSQAGSFTPVGASPVLVQLAVGDFLEVWGFQDGGATVSASADLLVLFVSV